MSEKRLDEIVGQLLTEHGLPTVLLAMANWHTMQAQRAKTKGASIRLHKQRTELLNVKTDFQEQEIW